MVGRLHGASLGYRYPRHESLASGLERCVMLGEQAPYDKLLRLSETVLFLVYT